MGLIAFHALVLIVKVSTSICSCSYWFKLPFVLVQLLLLLPFNALFLSNDRTRLIYSFHMVSSDWELLLTLCHADLHIFSFETSMVDYKQLFGRLRVHG